MIFIKDLPRGQVLIECHLLALKKRKWYPSSWWFIDSVCLSNCTQCMPLETSPNFIQISACKHSRWHAIIRKLWRSENAEYFQEKGGIYFSASAGRGIYDPHHGLVTFWPGTWPYCASEWALYLSWAITNKSAIAVLRVEHDPNLGGPGTGAVYHWAAVSQWHYFSKENFTKLLITKLVGVKQRTARKRRYLILVRDSVTCAVTIMVKAGDAFRFLSRKASNSYGKTLRNTYFSLQSTLVNKT